MKAIINADDFGINSKVTLEIEKMIEKGCISSTTIMANGKCLEEVRRFANAHSGISYGVHLCLTEFESLTKSEILRKYNIINSEGVFINKAIFKIRNYPQELLVAIEEELCAQIDIIKNLGIPISHADSHHHVHTIPQLYGVIHKVLNHYNITKVRLPMDFLSWRMRLHIVLWWKRKKLISKYRNTYKTTDLFAPYSQYSMLSAKSGSVVELMCHPGHSAKKYVDEMKLVESHTYSEHFSIINYNQVD